MSHDHSFGKVEIVHQTVPIGAQCPEPQHYKTCTLLFLPNASPERKRIGIFCMKFQMMGTVIIRTMLPVLPKVCKFKMIIITMGAIIINKLVTLGIVKRRRWQFIVCPQLFMHRI